MNKNVLYVDDEEINLELFRLNFENDFNVITALSGPEALKILKTFKEDIPVIVSDLRMPGMTGLEMISKIKSQTPEKVCIMLTAYADTDVMMIDINEELIYRYMLKPWRKPDLYKTIIHAFEKYSGAPEFLSM